MRRVPEFLPYRVPCRFPFSHGREPTSKMEVVQTWMELQLFQSTSIIKGLLMTEVLSPQGEAERYFFGYKCVGCENTILVPSNVRNEWDLDTCLGHTCDTSEIQRAVRNARYMALEKGEMLMEGPNGGWNVERRDQSFCSQYIQNPFGNDSVFSSEQVSKMYDHGIINNRQANMMLRMQYDTRDYREFGYRT